MSKIDCLNCKHYDFNACDGVDWCKLNHEETGICGNCDREFEDLEEATTHYDALVEENNTFLMENSKMAGEIKDLQSQLAKKEKEIESLKLERDNAVSCANMFKVAIIENQNQKAIEQLEKVKEVVKHFCELHSDEFYGVKFQVMGIREDVFEFIDQKINKLKGE